VAVAEIYLKVVHNFLRRIWWLVFTN